MPGPATSNVAACGPGQPESRWRAVLSCCLAAYQVVADGATVTAPATGELTLHGTKKTVTTDVTAKRTGGTIQVNGTIPVVFADYGIPNPSFGPANTDDRGEIEFLVSFVKSNT